MILKALKYTRFEGEVREWKIVGKEETGDQSFATFDNLNLLVGKNASGKSRTLDVIRDIADLLAGRTVVSKAIYPTEKYELIFNDDEHEFRYLLNFKNKDILDETLLMDGAEVLNRKKATIYDLANKKVLPLVQKNPLMLAVRETNESGEHYFNLLVEWSEGLKNFLFSNQREKNSLVKDYTRLAKEDKDDIEDTGILIYNFHRGMEEFGEPFKEEIMTCMSHLGYYISDISIQKSKAGYGLHVEEERKFVISQKEMSQGMFRALALFIQLTYARVSNIPVCVLVDDMGEGIDYDKSKELISIVIKKVNHSTMQFFMTTNDRYIMNKIPLKYWTIIDRCDSKSIFYSYNNSKDIYDDFKYTGLNNFDFLTTDFYKNGFGDAETEA